MRGFFVFAFAFAALITVVVRAGRLRVRKELRERSALALTAGFIALLFLAWWFITRGHNVEDRIIPPLILTRQNERHHERLGERGLTHAGCGGNNSYVRRGRRRVVDGPARPAGRTAGSCSGR